MLSEIEALGFEVTNVGKRIKSSKQRYSWRLNINESQTTVDLFNSKLSKRLKLFVDSQLMFQEKKKKSEQTKFYFKWKGHNFILLQQGKTFELRVDNVTFSHLQLNYKTKTEFEYSTPQEHQPPNPFDVYYKQTNTPQLSPRPSVLARSNYSASDLFVKPKVKRTKIDIPEDLFATPQNKNLIKHKSAKQFTTMNSPENKSSYKFLSAYRPGP